ncbi:peptide chain release factor 3 [Blastococcus sp. TF02-09]|uniref:peptide chain release factor 3 n=1 Tax=Blastococcus sp. TF02-09 TaxID=2250576 RepID=UPI000DEBAA60|nr:peptide chain release factor 3 [Blastococcus sp. TF02-9]RBY81204.1 peptide chain release factor 3 [Blastococcus sp. TF02-9]
MSVVEERAGADRSAREALGQASRRRTFAVISHPDAGKSTLTEALALHARVIGQAGAVHGKAGRRGTVSDWMDIEKQRGISITSAALQFEYRDAVINLLDTPGHADFSEDTYRVLTAVDAAVMLVDAAKGLEAQTMKLFAVCRHRGIPVLTVINKWDRPGKDALELMDEITERTGLAPTPLTWPVGLAGDFRGVLDRSDGSYRRFTRTAGGATIAPEETLSAAAALDREGDAWQQAVEEVELLGASGQDHDQSLFLDGVTTPVLFASAVSNFGVGALLDTLVDLAPAPTGMPTADGAVRALTDPFSAFVFKVQAGMDTAHRDRLAFIRIASGVFERGMVVTHARTGRPFATKYAQHVFGRDRESIDVAYPGDVVGLVNATALGVGDTLYAEQPVQFPPLTTFAPEHFAVCHSRDAAKHKQFRKGIAQLDSEGVVQVLTSERRGDGAPVLAVVGPMQFEVATHRMEHEFGAPVDLDRLPYSLALRTDAASAPGILASARNAEILRRGDGELLAVFPDKWGLRVLQQNKPELTLEPLVAAQL